MRSGKSVSKRDPGILGRVIRTSLGSFAVVGVASPGFLFPRDSALWIPIESELRARNGSRQMRFYRKYRVVARLRDGASLPAAQDDLRQIGTRLQREQAPTNRDILPVVEPLRTVETSEMRPYVLLLMAGAGLVLLVCCTNLANLAAGAVVRPRARVRRSRGHGRRAKTSPDPAPDRAFDTGDRRGISGRSSGELAAGRAAANHSRPSFPSGSTSIWTGTYSCSPAR